MAYVDVYYSDATFNPIIIPANVNAGPLYLDVDSLNVMYVQTSVTQDSDKNGKIDSILVSVPANINDDFSGFVANVTGYTVDNTKGVNGYADAGSFTSFFYIYLKEGKVLDTGVTPTWTIVSNTTLKDQVTNNKLVAIQFPPFASTDSAKPVLGYTLGVAGKNQVFVASRSRCTVPRSRPWSQWIFNSRPRRRLR